MGKDNFHMHLFPNFNYALRKSDFSINFDFG